MIPFLEGSGSHFENAQLPVPYRGKIAHQLHIWFFDLNSSQSRNTQVVHITNFKIYLMYLSPTSFLSSSSSLRLFSTEQKGGKNSKVRCSLLSHDYLVRSGHIQAPHSKDMG